MMLFKCILLLLFCLGGMFSISRVFELCLRVHRRKADRTRLARLESSNDLFLAVTWLLSSCVCALVFTVLAII